MPKDERDTWRKIQTNVICDYYTKILNKMLSTWFNISLKRKIQETKGQFNIGIHVSKVN